MLISEWTAKDFADDPVSAKSKEELVEIIGAGTRPQCWILFGR